MPRQRTHHRSGSYYVFPDDFGDCLVRFKEESGLSWAEIARRLGTTPLTVRRWWKHGVRPSSHYLLALQDLADGMGLGHMLPEASESGACPSEPEDPFRTDGGGSHRRLPAGTAPGFMNARTEG